LPDRLYRPCNLRERGDRRSRKSGRHLGQLYEPCNGSKLPNGIKLISVYRRMQQYLRE
jgi:hypothetical protein